jgi:hypothetical protein
VAGEKHGSAVRDSDGVKPASVQICLMRILVGQAMKRAGRSCRCARFMSPANESFLDLYVLGGINIGRCDAVARDARSDVENL